MKMSREALDTHRAKAKVKEQKQKLLNQVSYLATPCMQLLYSPRLPHPPKKVKISSLCIYF